MTPLLRDLFLKESNNYTLKHIAWSLHRDSETLLKLQNAHWSFILHVYIRSFTLLLYCQWIHVLEAISWRLIRAFQHNTHTYHAFQALWHCTWTYLIPSVPLPLSSPPQQSEAQIEQQSTCRSFPKHSHPSEHSRNQASQCAVPQGLPQTPSYPYRC